MAKPLIAGNWKMHGTVEQATAIASRLAAQWCDQDVAEMVVFPPYVHLTQVMNATQDTVVAVGAQNVCQYDIGAYTGEVSAAMLADLGCRYVLVGHSERRALFDDSNQTVAEKFKAAQQAGITPILCVGETLQQRQRSQTLDVVAQQIDAVTEVVSRQDLCSAVIAYEPVWAIGTGETATPQQAQEVHSAIRVQLGVGGSETTLLYGGSVNANNAAELFAQPDINGGLVGGASLKADEFLTIAQQLIEQA